MALAAVTQAFSQYAQQVVGGSGSSSAGTSVAAQQEANETLATTKQEAAKGDRQAKIKLAKLAQNTPAASATATAPSEPGKGSAVDKIA